MRRLAYRRKCHLLPAPRLLALSNGSKTTEQKMFAHTSSSSNVSGHSSGSGWAQQAPSAAPQTSAAEAGWFGAAKEKSSDAFAPSNRNIDLKRRSKRTDNTYERYQQEVRTPSVEGKMRYTNPLEVILGSGPIRIAPLSSAALLLGGAVASNMFTRQHGDGGGCIPSVSQHLLLNDYHLGRVVRKNPTSQVRKTSTGAASIEREHNIAAGPKSYGGSLSSSPTVDDLHARHSFSSFSSPRERLCYAFRALKNVDQSDEAICECVYALRSVKLEDIVGPEAVAYIHNDKSGGSGATCILDDENLCEGVDVEFAALYFNALVFLCRLIGVSELPTSLISSSASAAGTSEDAAFLSTLLFPSSSSPCSDASSFLEQLACCVGPALGYLFKDFAAIADRQRLAEIEEEREVRRASREAGAFIRKDPGAIGKIDPAFQIVETAALAENTLIGGLLAMELLLVPSGAGEGNTVLAGAEKRFVEALVGVTNTFQATNFKQYVAPSLSPATNIAVLRALSSSCSSGVVKTGEHRFSVITLPLANTIEIATALVSSLLSSEGSSLTCIERYGLSELAVLMDATSALVRHSRDELMHEGSAASFATGSIDSSSRSEKSSSSESFQGREDERRRAEQASAELTEKARELLIVSNKHLGKALAASFVSNPKNNASGADAANNGKKGAGGGGARNSLTEIFTSTQSALSKSRGFDMCPYRTFKAVVDVTTAMLHLSRELLTTANKSKDLVGTCFANNNNNDTSANSSHTANSDAEVLSAWGLSQPLDVTAEAEWPNHAQATQSASSSSLSATSSKVSSSLNNAPVAAYSFSEYLAEVCTAEVKFLSEIVGSAEVYGMALTWLRGPQFADLWSSAVRASIVASSSEEQDIAWRTSQTKLLLPFVAAVASLPGLLRLNSSLPYRLLSDFTELTTKNFKKKNTEAGKEGEEVVNVGLGDATEVFHRLERSMAIVKTVSGWVERNEKRKVRAKYGNNDSATVSARADATVGLRGREGVHPSGHHESRRGGVTPSSSSSQGAMFRMSSRIRGPLGSAGPPARRR